jgi:hypothetical protein
MAQEKMGKSEEEAVVEDFEQNQFSLSRQIEHCNRDGSIGGKAPPDFSASVSFACSKREVAMLKTMVATENQLNQ